MRDESTGNPASVPVLIVALVAGAIAAGLVLQSCQPRRVTYRPAPDPWPGWQVVGLIALGLLMALIVAVVLYALFRLALAARLAAAETTRQRQLAYLDINNARLASFTEAQRAALEAARLTPVDGAGRLGALGRQLPDGSLQIINLDVDKASVVMGADGSVVRTLADPLTVAQVQAHFAVEMKRAESAAFPLLTNLQTRNQVSGQAPAHLEPPTSPAVTWPERVLLRDLVDRPSLSRLVLGVTVDAESGQVRPVTANLRHLLHSIIAGSSGWGKSSLARAIAFQLALAGEPVRLAMIDLSGITFAPFAKSDRLLWPAAQRPDDALAIIDALGREMGNRLALFQEHPGIDSLEDYNAQTREPLPDIVCLIDEAPALLADREAHARLRLLVQQSRKVGIWFVCIGPEWKADIIRTGLRDQFSTRVHFRAQSSRQSDVVLGSPVAATIEAIGRAWAQFPGQKLTEIQAPYIGREEIIAALAGQSGPAQPMPVPDWVDTLDGMCQANGEVAADYTNRQRLALDDLELELSRYALENLGGQFIIRPLADAFADRGLTPDKVRVIRDRMVARHLLSPAQGTREPARLAPDFIEWLSE